MGSRPDNIVYVNSESVDSADTISVVFLAPSSEDATSTPTALPLVHTKRIPRSELSTAELDSLTLGLKHGVVDVVLNPFCGYQQARACYDAVVAPLLAQAGLNVELHETLEDGDGTRLGKQFRASARKLNLIVLGGDGTVGELLNGLGIDQDGKFGSWPGNQIELCIVPQGTANALYHSLFPPESVSASTESLLDPFRSLTAFLRQSSRLCPLNIALNTLHRSSDLVRQVLTTVVTSTALHASLLSDAEALRATVPGLERFKIAAMQNVSNWNDGRLVLNGDVQIYTTENKGFTGLQDDTVIDGPFLYLVTALVDRFEPTFIVAPYQAPSGSNRKLAPQHPVIDVIAIRPLRHSTTSDLYTAAQKEQDRKQIRQDYAKNLGPVTGGMYGGGTHVDLKYDDAPTVSIVEYYRCKQITWEPVATEEFKTRLVCLDGALEDLGRGGKLESQVLGAEAPGIMMWM